MKNSEAAPTPPSSEQRHRQLRHSLKSTTIGGSALLSCLPSWAANAGQGQTLWETAVIGGAGGVVIGLVFVLKLYVYDPLKKRLQARQAARHIHNAGLTELHVAAANGDIQALTKLLLEGANPNATGSAGETPLMLAVKNDHRAAVRALLAQGADAQVKSHKGNTAIDIARKHKRLVMVDILNDHLASLESKVPAE